MLMKSTAWAPVKSSPTGALPFAHGRNNRNGLTRYQRMAYRHMLEPASSRRCLASADGRNDR